MSTFNPSNGSVSGTGSDGYGFTWTPPFTSQAQIDSYIQALGSISSLKKAGIMNISGSGNLAPSATISAVSTSNELPAVQVYNIANPPIFAVVYTDSNGASNFSYKNDPSNRIRLVQGGSRIDPLVSGASPSPASGSPITTGTVDTVKQTYATSSTQESSGGGILGAICWCLSCMSSIGFVCFIGFIVYMALKKQP
jgi:hypothetical protein